MKFVLGDNDVRVISSPHQIYQHWEADVSGQSRTIPCAVNDCPLCATGSKAKPHWYLAVIDRKTNTPKTVKVGIQIFKAIKELADKKAWGDPRGYDLCITRKEPGQNPLYVVTPGEKKPFTAEEKQMAKDFFDRVKLEDLSAAPSPEEVASRMGIELKPKKVEGGIVVASGAKTEEADSDFDFND